MSFVASCFHLLGGRVGVSLFDGSCTRCFSSSFSRAEKRKGRVNMKEDRRSETKKKRKKQRELPSPSFFFRTAVLFLRIERR